MSLVSQLRHFAAAESGATGADWAILIGSVCGLAVIVASEVGNSTASLGDELRTVITASALHPGGRSGGPASGDTCPTVAAEGSVTRWTDEAVCNADGNFCHPAVFNAIASYTMTDGSEWTAQMQQAEGERLYTRWFDATGTEVPEPCFPS